MEVADLTPIEGHPTSPPVVLIFADDEHEVHPLEEAFRERRIAVRCIVLSIAPQLHASLRQLPAGTAPRLIIIDLAVPGSSGHDLLRTLVADPRWRRIPKVVLSGSEREAERTASFAAGAVEHLVKTAHVDACRWIVDRLQAYLVAGMAEKV